MLQDLRDTTSKAIVWTRGKTSKRRRRRRLESLFGLVFMAPEDVWTEDPPPPQDLPPLSPSLPPRPLSFLPSFAFLQNPRACESGLPRTRSTPSSLLPSFLFLSLPHLHIIFSFLITYSTLSPPRVSQDLTPRSLHDTFPSLPSFYLPFFFPSSS